MGFDSPTLHVRADTEEEHTVNTTDAAKRLGTDPKTLRRFLRWKKSTYEAVGSTGRYEFADTAIPELQKRFDKWYASKTAAKRPVDDAQTSATPAEAVHDPADRIVLEDIRDPRVRERVRAVQRSQEARLDERLLAAGLHITQRGSK